MIWYEQDAETFNISETLILLHEGEDFRKVIEDAQINLRKGCDWWDQKPNNNKARKWERCVLGLLRAYK